MLIVKVSGVSMVGSVTLLLNIYAILQYSSAYFNVF